MQRKEKTFQAENTPIATKLTIHEQATPEDVMQVLLTENLLKEVEVLPAKADDVLQALAIVSEQVQIPATRLTAPVIAVDKVDSSIVKKVSHVVNAAYYQTKALTHPEGYIIQIAGFSDEKLWLRFVDKHSAESLYSYQRALADKTFTVVTSKVFATKTEA